MKEENIKPYPEVRVERPNLEYAKILLQNYAGEISEDTSIHLYKYQHFLQSDKWKEFSEALNRIARDEALHIELLGETILKLGLNPIYATIGALTGERDYWTSENVDYVDVVEKMLQTDIRVESLAITQYELHKEIIDDIYIKALIDRIVEDEIQHLSIFQSLYNQVTKEEQSSNKQE